MFRNYVLVGIGYELRNFTDPKSRERFRNVYNEGVEKLKDENFSEEVSKAVSGVACIIGAAIRPLVWPINLVTRLIEDNKKDIS